MLIKARNSTRSRRLAAAFGLPGFVFLAASASLLGASLIVGVILGQRVEEKGQGSLIRFASRSAFAMNIVDPALSAVKAFALNGENVPINFVKGLASDAGVDRLVIDIKQAEFQRLAAKRDEALRVGLLFADENDWVRAGVTLNGVAARAKVRLKGDWPDHFETDKWSLRINLSGDHTLLGMGVFSIQRPGTRNYVNEWVVHQALRREGVLVPEYRFIDVTINGTRKGIYALEEHFEKQIIERASLREGPIVRFNEDLLWKEYVALGTSFSEYGSFSASGVDGWATETGPGSQFERAVGMLEGFRRRLYRTTEVFDAEKLAAFVAMRDLSGADHIAWENMRFYYNPVTSRLEPIAYDNAADPSLLPQQLFGFAGGLRLKGAVGVTDEFAQLLFADTDFFSAYARALHRMSEERYVDELLAAIEGDLKRQLTILYQDYPYVGWSPESLRRNQAFIRRALAPEVAIHAYRRGTTLPESLVIDAGNLQSLPVEIVGVSVGNNPPIPPSERTVLGPRRQQQPAEYVPVRFPLPAAGGSGAPPAKDLTVRWRVLGTDTVRSAPIQEWSYLAAGLLESDWRLKPPPLSEPFLTADKARKTLTFASGTWVVDHTVVLPAGYRVLAGPGLRLDLRNGAKIISFSPLQFLGTEDAPIRIASSDGSGQGLAVIQAGEPSTLRHVMFDNLGPPAENGWRLTGAVTFYESPVDLHGVLFQRSRAEDALNIMRSRFQMVRTAFVDADSDCFDGDFVTGRIEDSSFLRCGNDGIDVSGSSVELARIRIDHMGDKGVSAGEASQIVAHDLRIGQTEIGIASKDSSTVTASLVEITDGGVGVTAFGKKSEFGPSAIHLTGLQMRNMRAGQLVEKGARLTIDKEEQPAELLKVESMFYGAKFGKASR